ncbi:MAG TPA: MBL fold metallo-hydrolase [Bacteroidia bacterium]|nr:MBL fold metallo-hydrolase [Bacteroidia bacterium]HRS59207.1 MBL fold metallo-hydrolase [Bacteroidia bacterium]HRU67255.1 MBL fold metallo-hydrolase [Bacteroidia bacterium]
MLKVKKFIFNSFGENTYLVYNTSGEAVVIDPGMSDSGEEKQFISFLNDNKLKIIGLINTHCHIDHISGNRFIADTFQVGLSAHQGEMLNIQIADQQAVLFGMPKSNTPVISEFLEEGDEIKIDESSLKVLHTPGHTRGGISLYAEKEGFIVCGDLIFRGSIGRVDLPGGDYDTILKSIMMKIFTLPENTIIYSGHGDETTVGFEKKFNPFFR